MSQSSINLGDQTGYEYVQAVNSGLQAVATDFSGNTAPTTTYPFMKWRDTSVSPSVIKVRNSTNTAWVVEEHHESYDTTRTVVEKLSDIPSVKDSPYNAKGDGTTDDTSALNSAATSGLKQVLLPSGDFVHTGINNKFGVEFSGNGRLLQAVTGGYKQTNSYSDDNKYVFGREYLSYFHKLLQSDAEGSLQAQKKIIFSGDSTTEGGAATSPYLMNELIAEMALGAGVRGVVGINAGHSGQSTVEWLNSYLAADLAQTPHLYIIRWGINDPYVGIHNLTVDQYLTNIRQGLATIRASRPLNNLSIILMSPNSTYDVPNRRDSKWYEAIIPGLKQAARDYQCCFVDTYAYLRDSVNGSDWMDAPYSDDRHIHPQNIGNMWIASLLGEVLFPAGLHRISDNKFYNVSGSYATKTSTDLPSTYPIGISVYRATGGSTPWPHDGFVMTTRSPDSGGSYQINWEYGGSGVAIRTGITTAWDAFVETGGLSGTWSPTILGQTTVGTPTYTTQAGFYTVNGNTVTAWFQISLSSKGGMAGSIWVGNLPFVQSSADAPFTSMYISRFAGVTLGSGYTQVSGNGINNTKNVLIIQCGSSQGVMPIDASNVSDTAELYGCITYKK